MADEEKPSRTPPELARARELAARTQTDLRLLADATRSASRPYSDLAKVQRATNEIKNLLSALGGK